MSGVLVDHREAVAGLDEDVRVVELPQPGRRSGPRGRRLPAGPRTGVQEEAQLIRGQCVPMGEEGLPYAPIVGALRDLENQHGREQIVEWVGAGRQALGALLPDVGTAPRENEDTIRLQLFEAVTMLMGMPSCLCCCISRMVTFFLAITRLLCHVGSDSNALL